MEEHKVTKEVTVEAGYVIWPNGNNSMGPWIPKRNTEWKVDRDEVKLTITGQDTYHFGKERTYSGSVIEEGDPFFPTESDAVKAGCDEVAKGNSFKFFTITKAYREKKA